MRNKALFLSVFCILFMNSLKTFSDVYAETEQQDSGLCARDGKGGELGRAAQMFWRPDGVRDGGVESGHGARRVAHERPHHHTDHPGESEHNTHRDNRDWTKHCVVKV